MAETTEIEPQERYSSSNVLVAANELVAFQAGQKREIEKANRSVSSNLAHTFAKEELAKEYNTNLESGLTIQEYESRFLQYGENRLTPPRQQLPILSLLSSWNCCNIIVAILCLVAYAVIPSLNNIPTIILGFLILFIQGFAMIHKFNEMHAANVTNGRPIIPTVITIRNGTENATPQSELVPGDIIRLEMGMQVPADVRVFECSDLEVDNSSLTGESEPQTRSADADPDETPAEARNLCFFGTLIVRGRGKAVVIFTGDETFMGRTVMLATAVDDYPTTLERFSKRISTACSCCNCIIGVIFFILIIVVEDNIIVPILWLIISLFFVVISMLVPMYFAYTQSKLMRDLRDKHILVKSMESIEVLTRINCVVIGEKTGCVTTGVMTTQYVSYDLSPKKCDTTDPRNAIKGDFYVDGDQGRHATLLHLIRGFALNTDVTMSDIENSTGNATSTAIATFSIGHVESEYKIDFDQYRSDNKCVFALPFNSRNKWEARVNLIDPKYFIGTETGDCKDQIKACITIRGAPQRVLEKCNRIFINNETKELTDDYRKQIISSVMGFGQKGLRVLGFAELLLKDNKYTENYEFTGDNSSIDKLNIPFEEFVFVGLVGLIDPPRPGVTQAITKLRNDDIKVVMLSGDHPVTTTEISVQIGLISENKDESDTIVFAGHEFMQHTSDKAYLAKRNIIGARLSPQQKLEVVDDLQRNGFIVLSVGKGVAEAQCLKQSNIGVAMGISGVEIAKAASEMILLDDNFSNIYAAIDVCKNSKYAELTKLIGGR